MKTNVVRLLLVVLNGFFLAPSVATAATLVENATVLDNPKRVERFLREAKAAANLRHPHILPVYDAGRNADRYYIASAFIDGRPLADEIADARDRAEPIDFPRAARLVRSLAEALAYAHDQGIVHRDVKPANCMVDAAGQLHLMDFGLASRQDDESRLTNDGAVLGTPAYMAPEQAAGQTSEANPVADQYAAGVVLYELLTSRVPFDGTPAIVLHNVIHTDPDPPRKHRPDVPKDLETICLKAMRKTAGDRYASCQEMADDLRRWQEGESIAARRLSLRERTIRWVRKNPAMAMAGSVSVLAMGLVAVAVVLWGGMYQNEQEQRGGWQMRHGEMQKAPGTKTGTSGLTPSKK